MTESLMRSAQIVGVPVLDHVIVTRAPGRFHSMVDRGTLPNIDNEPEPPLHPEHNPVVEIERELAERFSSTCLDNYAERWELAVWIAEREARATEP